MKTYLKSSWRKEEGRKKIILEPDGSYELKIFHGVENFKRMSELGLLSLDFFSLSLKLKGNLLP